MDTKNNTEPKGMTKEEYIEALRTIEREKEEREKKETNRKTEIAVAVNNAFFKPIVAFVFILIFGLLFGIKTLQIYTIAYFFICNGITLHYLDKAKQMAKELGIEQGVPYFSYLIVGNFIAFPFMLFITFMFVAD